MLVSLLKLISINFILIFALKWKQFCSHANHGLPHLVVSPIFSLVTSVFSPLIIMFPPLVPISVNNKQKPDLDEQSLYWKLIARIVWVVLLLDIFLTKHWSKHFHGGYYFFCVHCCTKNEIPISLCTECWICRALAICCMPSVVYGIWGLVISFGGFRLQ